MRTPIRLFAIPSRTALLGSLFLRKKAFSAATSSSGSRSSPPTTTPRSSGIRAIRTTFGPPLFTIWAAAIWEAPIFRPTSFEWLVLPFAFPFLSSSSASSDVFCASLASLAAAFSSFLRWRRDGFLPGSSSTTGSSTGGGSSPGRRNDLAVDLGNGRSVALGDVGTCGFVGLDRLNGGGGRDSGGDVRVEPVRLGRLRLGAARRRQLARVEREIRV